MVDGEHYVTVVGALSTLASAVAGRKLNVAMGTAPRAYFEGDVIYLAADGRELHAGTVVLQAALLCSGSLDPRIVRRLSGRPSLRLRYLTLEAVRVVSVLPDLVPTRVAVRVREVYDATPTSSPEDSYETAVAGGKTIPEAPAWFGSIRAAGLAAGTSGGTPRDNDCDGTTTRDADAPDELDEEQEADTSRILNALSSPLRNPLGNLLQEILGAGRSPNPDKGGGAEWEVAESRVGPVGARAKAVTERFLKRITFPAGAPVGVAYPEWDHFSDRFRPDWCSVAEFDPRSASTPDMTRAGDDRALRVQLARLGLSPRRHRRQSEGDSLDPTALVDYATATARGDAGDPRVYEQRRRTDHDLGVLILLDATGSTGDSVEGSRLFDEQRHVVARLTAALDDLGVRVAAHAFNSRGRAHVRYLRIKSFDDAYDAAAQRRLAGVEPTGFTRLGAAVRHGAHVLQAGAATPHMLLIVVGDGLPYDDGYEATYAQEDTRRALADAVAVGVACACIAVNSPTEPAVIERVWGHVSHRLLTDEADLAREACDLFRVALKEAAASQRVDAPTQSTHQRGLAAA